MKKPEIKVVVTLTEGYEERFTAACIKVAQRRVESTKNTEKNQEKMAV